MRRIALLLVATLNAGCDQQIQAPMTPIRLSVTSVLPSSGPSDSVVDVRIVGSGFRSGVTVRLGSAATDVTVYGAGTSIGARVAAHAAGVVNVVVTNPDGERITLTSAYTFVPVTVTGVDPTGGLAGDTVTITGSGFAPGVSVTFDGVPAVVVRRTVSAIDAVVPMHARGAVDVAVKNAGATLGVTAASRYFYEAISIGGQPSRVAPGDSLTIAWAAPPGRSAGDWISLVGRGDPEGHYRWYAHTGGLAAGALVLSAPAQPGQYEARYMIGDAAVVVSPPIVVSAVASRLTAAGSARER